MATVFKRDGRGPWLIGWTDHLGRRKVRSSKTTCKATAARLAAKMEADAALRRGGIIDAAQERLALEGGRPIGEHLGDFEAGLLAKGNTRRHVVETLAMVRWVVAQCHAARLADLSASGVQGAIGALRTAGKSARTLNAYLTAAKALTRWAWRDRRTPDDPLAALSRLNEATDLRHCRRALEVAELEELLVFVERHSLAWHGLDGPSRAMLYRLALGSGLRAGELRSLTPEAFDLDADPPVVTVEAAYSKRRRRDSQPIRRELAELLRPWLADKPAGERVFRRMPEGTARMLRRDLEAARAAWIAAAPEGPAREAREQSDFLVYRNAAGEVADFHSCRHAYISAIVAGGASVKVAQELARHSDPRLTIGRYSHARLHDLAGALEALPDMGPAAPKEPEIARATGTDGPMRAAQGAAHAQRAGRETVPFGTTGREDATRESGDRKLSAEPWPTARKPRKTKGGSDFQGNVNRAEGTGLEPATPCGAPDFESDGIRPDSPKKPGIPEEGAAHAQRADAPPAPELAELLASWPTLPEPIRAAIVALVRAGRPRES